MSKLSSLDIPILTPDVLDALKSVQIETGNLSYFNYWNQINSNYYLQLKIFFFQNLDL